MRKEEILEALRADAEEQRQHDLSEDSQRDVRLAVGRILAERERSASPAEVPWALLFRRAAAIGIPTAVAALLLVYVSNIDFPTDPNVGFEEHVPDPAVAAKAMELEKNVDLLQAELRRGIDQFHEKYLASSKRPGVSAKMDMLEQRIRESLRTIEKELKLTRSGMESTPSGSS
jgi:hypothetical protein